MNLNLKSHNYYYFIKNWFKNLVQAKSLNKNLKRQELRLNILLVFSIISFILISSVQLINLLIKLKEHCLPLIYAISILIFLIFLLWLSKKGKIKIATWLLIATYTLPMFHLFILRGADLPAALLLAVLSISLSGLLIGENLALISSGIIGSFIIILAYLQKTGLMSFNNYWRSEKNGINDATIYALLLLTIATIAWLFARNLKQALNRAQKSEKKLQEEYDLLEIKVIEKTEQLYQIREEKILELYRLAEFGRLSSGIFHDLINPLTAVSLNLEQINQRSNKQILNTQNYLGQALLAAHRMESMISGIKRQIQQKSCPNIFIINKEIEQTIEILNYKARQAKVKINFITSAKIKLYGDVVKFGQIIINLLANAIEASEEQIKTETKQNSEKEIQIKLIKQKNNILILVNDKGSGISLEHIDKIFKPFFSTKTETGKGLGMGLASVKNIIEKSFSGNIIVKSQKNKGSQFRVSLPFNFPPDLINSNESL